MDMAQQYNEDILSSELSKEEQNLKFLVTNRMGLREMVRELLSFVEECGKSFAYLRVAPRSLLTVVVSVASCER